MPYVSKIKQTMKKQKIPAEIISQLPDPKDVNNPEAIIAFFNQMDKLLSREQCLSIMEQQGCSKTDTVAKPFREFGQKYADRTIEEKIEQLFDELQTGHKAPCRVNPDGTLSIYWAHEEKGKVRCVCRQRKGLSGQVSLTFCGCCGGHVRFTYQQALGVNLRLKEIVSSSLKSNGEKRCEFLFEIVNA